MDNLVDSISTAWKPFIRGSRPLPDAEEMQSRFTARRISDTGKLLIPDDEDTQQKLR